MIPRCLYIPLFILIACNSQTDEKKTNPLFGQRISYKTPDLALTCTRAIKTLDNEIHGVFFTTNTGQPISNDTIISLLYKISRYDIATNDRYETYLRTCNNVDFFTWKSKTHKNVITRIEKISLKAKILLSNDGNNLVSITDFDIYSVDKPNHVAVRIIDEYDLEYLKIDDEEYRRVAERILLGLDTAITKLDSAKKNACR